MADKKPWRRQNASILRLIPDGNGAVVYCGVNCSTLTRSAVIRPENSRSGHRDRIKRSGWKKLATVSYPANEKARPRIVVAAQVIVMED